MIYIRNRDTHHLIASRNLVHQIKTQVSVHLTETKGIESFYQDPVIIKLQHNQLTTNIKLQHNQLK